MRVLLTVNCKWWNAAAQGAAVTAQALIRAGHQVLVQTKTDSLVASKLRDMDIPFTALRFPALEIRRAAMGFRAQAIIAFRSHGQTISAVTARGMPLIRYRSDQRKPAESRLGRFLEKRTSLVVLPGAAMVDAGYRSFGKPGFAIIPHPVDTDYFTCENRQPEPLILSLARLSPVKGHRTLIKAMSRVEGCTAVISGREAQYTVQQLEDYAESVGSGHRVRFMDYQEDVRPLLRKASIGVVTSLGSEAVSRAGMEMMASGVPLLAAATNGLLDIVRDGDTGLLHSPGNWQQLAGQINHLMGNPGLREHLAVTARKYCEERLSLGAVGELWTSHLEQVCSQ